MRPTRVEGLIYAWDLVAKAIEHKALGIDASFAFLLFCEYTDPRSPCYSSRHGLTGLPGLQTTQRTAAASA